MSFQDLYILHIQNMITSSIKNYDLMTGN